MKSGSSSSRDLELLIESIIVSLSLSQPSSGCDKKVLPIKSSGSMSAMVLFVPLPLSPSVPMINLSLGVSILKFLSNSANLILDLYIIVWDPSVRTLYVILWPTDSENPTKCPFISLEADGKNFPSVSSL